jgi:lysozyme family protein
MQIDFDLAVTETLESEGIFSDDQYDAGGKTKYGITEQVAIANGYPDIENLTVDQAKDIYRKQYWNAIHGDDLQCTAIALILFDLAVNSGQGTAIKKLQDSLNLMNNNQKFWPNMEVDGGMGPVTLNAVNVLVPQFKKTRFLFMTLFFNRGQLYLEDCRNNQSQEKFIDGWEERLWKYSKYVPVQ